MSIKRSHNLSLSALVIAILAPACVTTHQGSVVQLKQQSVKLSCAENNAIDAEFFIAVSCTIENASTSWIDFKAESLRLRPNVTGISLSTPEEVAAFVEAYGFQKAKDDANAGLFLAGLAAVGAGMQSSPNATVSAAGAGMVAAGVAGAGGVPASSALATAQHGRLTGYGPEHLLAGQFKVPPKMFTRKQLLLQVSKDIQGMRIFPAKLEICYSLPTTDCVRVELRRSGLVPQ
jgi:hypothetical protein